MKRHKALQGRIFGRALLCGSALSGLMLAAGQVSAQTAPANAAAAQTTGTVGEVVVTARQRREDIQKVPAQVTAFTSKTIEAKGINNPADFLDAVPNVTFVATQNAGTSFIVIRGIAQARNSEPSVAVVVDGVPMTQPAEFNQALVDVQQIEVLKGPQGALYGRNAIGGAILITTAQPTDQWKGQATVGYENGPGYRLQGTISGPITDTLKFRGSVNYFDTVGHLRNVDTTDASAAKFADPVKDFSARVSFLYQPTSNFTADLRLSTDLLNTRGLYYVVAPFGSPNFNNPNYTSQPINLNNSGMDDRKIYDGALKLSYNAGLRDLHFDHRLQHGVGDPDRRRLSLRSVRQDADQLRLQSEPVPDGQDLQPGTALHLAGRTSGSAGSPARRSSPPTGSSPPATCSTSPTSGVQAIYRTPNPLAYQPHGQISFLADSAEAVRLGGLLRYLDQPDQGPRAVAERPLRQRPSPGHHRTPRRSSSTRLASRPRPVPRGRIPGRRSSPRPCCAIRRWTTSTSTPATAAASAAAASTRRASPRPPRPPASTTSATCSTPTRPTPTKSGFKSRWFDQPPDPERQRLHDARTTTTITSSSWPPTRPRTWATSRRRG